LCPMLCGRPIAGVLPWLVVMTRYGFGLLSRDFSTRKRPLKEMEL
jgi:hypothetical protein